MLADLSHTLSGWMRFIIHQCVQEYQIYPTDVLLHPRVYDRIPRGYTTLCRPEWKQVHPLALVDPDLEGSLLQIHRSQFIAYTPDFYSTPLARYASCTPRLDWPLCSYPPQGPALGEAWCVLGHQIVGTHQVFCVGVFYFWDYLWRFYADDLVLNHLMHPLMG